MIEREFWEAIRQALLMVVDAIEKFQLRYKMTTAQIRKQWKEARKELLSQLNSQAVR